MKAAIRVPAHSANRRLPWRSGRNPASSAAAGRCGRSGGGNGVSHRPDGGLGKHSSRGRRRPLRRTGRTRDNCRAQRRDRSWLQPCCRRARHAKFRWLAVAGDQERPVFVERVAGFRVVAERIGHPRAQATSIADRVGRSCRRDRSTGRYRGGRRDVRVHRCRWPEHIPASMAGRRGRRGHRAAAIRGGTGRDGCARRWKRRAG